MPFPSQVPLTGERKKVWWKYNWIDMGLTLIGALAFCLFVYQRHGTLRLIGYGIIGAVVIIMIYHVFSGKTYTGLWFAERKDIKNTKQKNEQELADFIASKKTSKHE